MNRTPQLAATYSTISPHDLLQHVVCDYQIEPPQQCLFWTRGANDTYMIDCGQTRYSLRVFRCGAYPREAIEFEVEALNYLHRNGCSVAYPIARKSGEYLTEITAPEGQRFVLVTAFADGEPPDYESVDNCRLVGESVGRMHETSSDFTTLRKRTRLDLQALLEDSMAVVRSHLAHRRDALTFLEAIARDAKAAVLDVPEQSLDFGLCHADLHGRNLHLHDGNITHFDFEECAFGYRVYDLATFKWDVCAEKSQARRWNAFLEGYTSQRSLNESDLALVDTFVIIRDLSNTAFGLRNIRDFGHELACDRQLDDQCDQLREFCAEHNWGTT